MAILKVLLITIILTGFAFAALLLKTLLKKKTIEGCNNDNKKDDIPLGCGCGGRGCVNQSNV